MRRPALPAPRALLALLSLLAVLAFGSPARARKNGPPEHPAAAASAAAHTPPPAPSEEAAPDSPRASVKRFLDLCHVGELAEAAGYLDLPDAQKEDGPRLARHLEAVLDKHLASKIEALSPRSAGDQGDHLPAGVELVGTVPGPGGPEQVRLVRRPFPDGARWIFSRQSVERIDTWYGRLRGVWIRDRLPDALLQSGPKDLLWWQWIALPVLFLLALGAGTVLGWGTRKVLARIVAWTSRTWDDALFARLTAPLTVVWAVAAVALALPRLSLVPAADSFIGGLVRGGLFVGLVWFATRCVDVGAGRLLEQTPAGTNPAARSLVPLTAKFLKVSMLVVAFLVALSELGVAVGSLVAGLGIGGVALALAAQKTVENLFGSLSIGVDQPFRVGDYVVVDGLSGTVESIGLRSTRIRTLDRTLVTLPNGKLADMRIESFAGRDRIKLGCTLLIAHGASSAALREVLAGLRAVLTEHPKIWPDVCVALSKVTDHGLEIEILAWFQTTSWDDFLRLREEVLLQMMERIEAAGAKLSHAPPS